MKFTSIFLLFCLFACTEEKAFYSEGDYVEHPQKRISSDIDIPRELWDEIESVLPDAPEEGAGETSSQSDLRLKRFMGTNVYLKDEGELGALGGMNHKLSFAAGGGHLDLSEYLRQRVGHYSIGFQPEHADDWGALRVFFVGHGLERKIQGQMWGSGCGKYAEITQYFKERVLKKGLKLDATEARDLAVVAGSYIFALPRQDGLYLSQISIYDGQRPELHCSLSPVHKN